MAKMDDKLFEDKPYDEELFEEKEYDGDLFEDDESIDISPDFQAPTKTSIDTPKGTELKEDEYGTLETIGLHTTPSPLGGLTGAAGFAYGELEQGRLPKKQELIDTYYESKKNWQKDQEGSMKENPLPAVGGMLLRGTGETMAGTKLLSSGLKGYQALKGVKTAADIGTKGAKALDITKKAANSKKLLSEFKRMKKLQTKIANLDRYKKTYDKIQSAENWLKRGRVISKNAKDLAKLTAVGGAYGTYLGGSEGEAKLFEGDVSGTVNEALEGMKLGTLMGLGFGSTIKGLQVGWKAAKAAAKGTKDFLKTEGMVKSYDLGKQDIGIKQADRINYSQEHTKNLKEDLGSVFGKLGAEKKQAMQYADDIGAKVKTEEDVLNTLEFLDKSGLVEQNADAKVIFNKLNEHLGMTKEMRKAEQKVVDEFRKMQDKAVRQESVVTTKMAKKKLKDSIKKLDDVEESISGEIKGTDLYPSDPAMKNLKMKTEVAKTGKGKLRVAAEDITDIRPSVKREIDPESGEVFLRVYDKNNPASHKVFKAGKTIKQLNPDGVSVKEAEKLYQELRPYSSNYAGDSVQHEIRIQADTLRKKLKDIISNKLKGIEYQGKPINKINEEFANLYDALEVAGIKSPLFKFDGRLASEQLRKISKLVESKADDKQTWQLLEDFTSHIEKGAPEVYKKHKKGMETLREIAKLEIPETGGSWQFIKAIAGQPGQIINQIANSLGKTAKKVGAVKQDLAFAKQGIQAAGKKLVNTSPESIQKLIKIAEEVGGTAKQYIRPLEKLRTSKKETRQVIMFGLMQQEDFRNLIKKNKMTKDPKDIKDKKDD